MHGGQRDKKTSLLYGGKVNLSCMAIMCDGSHSHLPWGLAKDETGLFATAQERNYPELFCKRIAARAARDLAVVRVKAPRGDPQSKSSAGVQPRRGFGDLIAEFKHVTRFEGALASEVRKAKSKTSFADEPIGDQFINGNAKVFDVAEYGELGLMKGKFGVYWSKEEFVNQARDVVHPLDRQVAVPPRVAKVMFDQATKGKRWLIENRLLQLDWYEQASKSLQPQEEELHRKLHKDVESVVSAKKILLFRRMLQDISYDDLAVCDLLIAGVKLVGEAPVAGIWKEDGEKLPSIDHKQIWATARESQRSVLTVRPSTTPDLDKKVWNLTKAEAEEGLLKGPLSRVELEAEVGPLWVAARRFGVVQGPKVRPVDDFSEYKVNQAFGSRERVNLLSADHVVAWSRAWIEAVKDDQTIEIFDTSGFRWTGELHCSWSADGWRSLVGRVADLKSAYKQIAADPAHACFSVIAALDTDSMQMRLYRAFSLMFGQTSAVYAFLRFSRALAAIAARIFSLVVVEFFDDFTQIESAHTAVSAMETMEGFLTLLGWEVARTESKRLEFDKCFVSLGISIDFSKARDRSVVVKNKPGRVQSICQEIDKIRERGSLCFKGALSLKGKVGFAEGQLFYRVAAPLCRLLAKWVSFGCEMKLTQELDLCLSTTKNLLLGAGPRIVRAISMERPVIVFTDGACEEDGTSIGAVMFLHGAAPQAFGAVLDTATVSRWYTKLGQLQVIGQAELFPLLVARLTWARVMVGRRVIFFVDNDSARMACIRAYSPVLPSLQIIMQCVQYDCQHQVSSWYARVPTHSNIADDPSRMTTAYLKRGFGAMIVPPVMPPDSGCSSILE